MKSFKLSFVNTLVVAGLVTLSMAMPVVAASLVSPEDAQHSEPHVDNVQHTHKVNNEH